MELCKSTLKEKLENKLTEYEIYDLFHQICAGLEHIHSKKIIHRDLKPANIFICNKNYLKIGDFGLSRTSKPTFQMQNGLNGKNNEILSKQKINITTKIALEKISSSLTHSHIGTSYYTAPEIEIRHQVYDEKADIYSLGTYIKIKYIYHYWTYHK